MDSMTCRKFTIGSIWYVHPHFGCDLTSRNVLCTYVQVYEQRHVFRMSSEVKLSATHSTDKYTSQCRGKKLCSRLDDEPGLPLFSATPRKRDRDVEDGGVQIAAWDFYFGY